MKKTNYHKTFNQHYENRAAKRPIQQWVVPFDKVVEGAVEEYLRAAEKKGEKNAKPVKV